MTVRILSDLRIPELRSWTENVTVSPPPKGHGLVSQAVAALKLVRSALSHDVVITANVRNGLALALFKRISGRTFPRHMMVEMRLDDPRTDWLWRAKVALQRFAYATVDRMCVSARYEIDAYSARLRVPKERLRFVPWHTNVRQPSAQQGVGGYVFSAGRTGRDWKTLAAAVKDLDAEVIVVCDRSAAEATAFPPNVAVHVDVPYSRYCELLRGAGIVVVPLEAHVYSSGQVVILEAMALGKPVVATNVIGTEDYLVDGVNGVLVEAHNPASLRAGLERLLGDAELQRRIGSRALEEVKARHTLETYVKTLLEQAYELGGAEFRGELSH